MNRAQPCFRREDDRGVGFDIEKRIRPDAREKERLEPPCRVLIHNDDVTPIEYVASLLHRVFELGWFREHPLVPWGPTPTASRSATRLRLALRSG